VLAGWSASGQPLSVTALALAAVVFLWTPAHFWGLAIARLEDYRRAGLPALPVVVGVGPTVRAVVLSAALTLLAGLVPLATGQLGSIYAATLVAATLLWGWPTVSLLRTTTDERAWLAYKTSGLFLLLVFVGALVDSLARSQ
jgi:protoheme IX farnesyltransferase